jgi:hypothetical protein
MKRRVNAAPLYRPAFTFVIRDNNAFVMPFTACVGRRIGAEAPAEWNAVIEAPPCRSVGL